LLFIHYFLCQQGKLKTKCLPLAFERIFFLFNAWSTGYSDCMTHNPIIYQIQFFEKFFPTDRYQFKKNAAVHQFVKITKTKPKKKP